MINVSLAASPEEVMRYRWLQLLEQTIPDVDMHDVNVVLENPRAARQFAAEYSQSSYTAMLAQDYAIGDYIASD